jgi:hypothetical protein
MTSYQNLLEYINYFINEDGSGICSWSNDAISSESTALSPYPIYNRDFSEFIDEVYNSGILDLDYIATLKNKSIPCTDEMIDFVESSDLATLRAILSFYICQEQFCEGLWILASKNRAFYRILVRLEKLEDKIFQVSNENKSDTRNI